MISGPVWLMQPIPYFGEKIRGEWIYEPKIDGWRMQIVSYEKGKIECWGRRLERNPNWSAKLDYMIEGLRDAVPEATILDCELCSSRGRRFIPSLFARKLKAKPIVYIFDMIFFNGADISEKPLRKRKDLLSMIRFKPPFFCVKGKKLTDKKKNFSAEIKKGHEGIVIKKMISPYQVGKEAPIATQWWRKIK